MNIYCCFYNLHKETERLLTPYPVHYLFMLASTSYLVHFAQRWGENKTWINVEHDTTFHEGALEELWFCKEPWCAFGVNEADDFSATSGHITPTLNLVKFEPEFMSAIPHVWINRPDNHAPEPWEHNDSYLMRRAAEAGLPHCHQHYPIVYNGHQSGERYDAAGNFLGSNYNLG